MVQEFPKVAKNIAIRYIQKVRVTLAMSDDHTGKAKPQPEFAHSLAGGSLMMVLGSQTRLSLRNVLFATDFSSRSEVAMPYSIGMSRCYGATRKR